MRERERKRERGGGGGKRKRKIETVKQSNNLTDSLFSSSQRGKIRKSITKTSKANENFGFSKKSLFCKSNVRNLRNRFYETDL